MTSLGKDVDLFEISELKKNAAMITAIEQEGVVYMIGKDKILL